MDTIAKVWRKSHKLYSKTFDFKLETARIVLSKSTDFKREAQDGQEMR
jgi:hypothetical protein